MLLEITTRCASEMCAGVEVNKHSRSGQVLVRGSLSPWLSSAATCCELYRCRVAATRGATSRANGAEPWAMTCSRASSVGAQARHDVGRDAASNGDSWCGVERTLSVGKPGQDASWEEGDQAREAEWIWEQSRYCKLAAASLEDSG